VYNRLILNDLYQRFSEPKRFIQVLCGPRQTGKTTIARQLVEKTEYYCHYATADEPLLKNHGWIEQQWELVRTKIKSGQKQNKGILILDEVQKLAEWSETVKRLWDEDSGSGLQLYVLILGSSPLLVQKGLTESLAGRFEIIHVTHWSFQEMQKAFNISLDQYIYYGGYPGAVSLIDNRHRWASYINDSLIETTISRILLMTRVDKPALLRRLFEIGCLHSGQVLSYQKMIGQLQDAGNTTTLAHYLNLLKGAGLIAGLSKFAENIIRQRKSSPKLLVLNTGLMTARTALSIEDAKKDIKFWGRLVESTIGAYIYNQTIGKNINVYYWAGRNREVDFVLSGGDELIAIEVKSSAKKTNLPGISEFAKEFPVTKKLLIGAQGIEIEEFLLMPVEAWFK
jgi:uncharacterized protein